MPSFAVGDVHGHRDDLVRLLREAGLVDRRERWSGADARLWLLGDLADRGPDGFGAIELVMRLEQEATGNVRCLLGNHDALLLAVARFPDAAIEATGSSFREVWMRNGGDERDLERLGPEHLSWIERMPAIGRDGEWLLLHADADTYLELGTTVGAANEAARAALADEEPAGVAHMLDVLFERGAFSDPARLDRVLATFGGSRIVHGHTPIAFVLGEDPAEVTTPLVYAGGRAVNADHCLFDGGPGFVVALDAVAVETGAPTRPA